ncbi:beta-glucosidase/6-phospho-beta-glucosidase/beta-galactosidase [Pantoea eucalypti]
MTPFITLFHFDMPMAMPEQEGRKNHQVVTAFSPTCG